MSPAGAVAFLASLGNILLGIFILTRNSRSVTNRLFAVLAAASAGWSVSNYISLVVTTPELSLFLTRLVMFFVVMQTTSFFLLMFSFPGPKIQIRLRWKRIYVALSLMTLAVTLSPFLFVGLDPAKTLPPPVPLPGPGMLFFLPHALISVFGGVIRLVRRLRKSTGLEKAQWRFIFYGTLALFTLVPLSNFVAVVVFRFSGLIVLSPLYTLLFVSLISYAIARHRLFDIRAVVAKAVAYALLLTTLAGLYGLAVFGISGLVLQTSTMSFRQNVVYIALAIILAFTFQPLRRFFERATDRLFFRDRYDSQELINSITKVLASELLLDNLLKESLELICRNVRVSFGQFMIFDKGRIYKVAHFGHLPNRIFTPSTLKPLSRNIIVEDDLGPGEKKELMSAHGVRVSVPLRTHEQFVGFLFLGDKQSGDIYSQQDLDLLEILSKELAIAITNAKAYEEIAQFNLTLQQRVNEATSRLRLANKNLKALDKTKDEFLSMASHQLRTPLTTIRGYISMILEGDAGKVSEGQKQFLTYALSGSERMVSLISDLLNVSRLSAGRFIIDKQPTDLVRVIEDEVRQLQTHADQKHLDLVFDRPKEKMPMVDIDEGKTRQVIMNFIDNAIYYTKEGGVFVTMAANEKDNAVTIKVRDTGIGVPLAAQKKLFTKFFRAGNAQEVRPDGTGLGLFLAKRVIEDQGGKIVFESTPGKGSVFGFEMPIKQLKPSTK